MAINKTIKINMSQNVKNILTNSNLHCANLHEPLEKNKDLMYSILNPSSAYKSENKRNINRVISYNISLIDITKKDAK